MSILPNLTGSTTIPLLARVAAFAERRHEILTGNLANASTPGYRARDLPVARFQQALSQAVSQNSVSTSGGVREWSHSAALGAAPLADFPEELLQAVEIQETHPSFQDGNNRSLERDVMRMSQNLMLQSLAIELLTAQFNRLQAVVSERP
jgi:flagellar basal-body rod protein FlgB